VSGWTTSLCCSRFRLGSFNPGKPRARGRPGYPMTL
jgi:hypothetical protein